MYVLTCYQSIIYWHLVSLILHFFFFPSLLVYFLSRGIALFDIWSFSWLEPEKCHGVILDI